MAAAAAAKLTAKTRKQLDACDKLLALGGIWEINKGKGKAVTAPPFWIWEGLATHAPEAAQLACEAADAASAAKYFEASACLQPSFALADSVQDFC